MNYASPHDFALFLALHLTTALAPSQSNSLPLSCAAQGTVGRGEMEDCSQLSRSAPQQTLSSPLSVVSKCGDDGWGVLDYAVHTFSL